MKLVVKLHEKFNGRRLELLKAREARQLRIDKGELPDFLLETNHQRERMGSHTDTCRSAG